MTGTVGSGPAAAGSVGETALGPGPVLRNGERHPYRAVAPAPGTARVRLDSLAPWGRRTATSVSLAFLAHVTDLQLADVQSPGRLEFMEELRGHPGAAALIPAQRAQEPMCAHAVAEAVRAVGRCLESRDTGAPLQLVVSTGDNLDNAQANELEWYVALMAGGRVALGAGAPYDGVQHARWPGADLYWRPDERNGRFQRQLGFPTLPGLLDRAVSPFDRAGLTIGWVSCYGNHDGLPFGEVVPTPAYRSLVVGGRKPLALPQGRDVVGHEDRLYSHPEEFLAGPARPVPPGAGRRIVDRRDFVAAHLAASGMPAGHGYSRRNLEDGTAYGVVELSPLVSLVLLDTTNLDGAATGSLGVRQLRWLEEELMARHARYRTPDGQTAVTANPDRLVVLASHHGPSSLTNLRRLEAGMELDQPRVGRDAVVALVHRFPNVVVWLNGHRHVHEIAVRRAPDGSGAFADIATCAIADWPSQFRLVELVANEDGTLSVTTGVVDHAAPPVPGDAAGDVEHLAALHRELAANVPGAGFGSRLEGTAADRNAEVLLPAPFPLAGRAAGPGGPESLPLAPAAPTRNTRP